MIYFDTDLLLTEILMFAGKAFSTPFKIQQIFRCVFTFLDMFKVVIWISRWPLIDDLNTQTLTRNGTFFFLVKRLLKLSHILCTVFAFFSKSMKKIKFVYRFLRLKIQIFVRTL